MTAVRMSAAKARQLGLPGIPKTTTKKGRTRRTAPGPYRTVCVMCREEFRTRVAEDRHVEQTQHPRYALVITTVQRSEWDPDPLDGHTSVHPPEPRT